LFSDPAGLAFDKAGNLYVANGGQGTVSQVTPAGVVITFASGFSDPFSLAFDAAGNLYERIRSGRTPPQQPPTEFQCHETP
jgi:DNA-binding beta-propeller fold protein YncE